MCSEAYTQFPRITRFLCNSCGIATLKSLCPGDPTEKRPATGLTRLPRVLMKECDGMYFEIRHTNTFKSFLKILIFAGDQKATTLQSRKMESQG